MSLMIILAPLTSLLVFFSLWGIFYQRQSEWRSSFLSASVAWGILLTAFLEVLGHFKLITFWWMLGAWGLVFVMTLPWAGKTIVNLKARLKSFPSLFITPFELSLLAGIGFIAGMVGLTAWIAPPNTVDSMIYHMARVMHWMQDQSIDHYPTHILRQLYLSPWSEFAILNFQILIGTDRLANFVQWFSMVGSAVGVSLIAKEFGAERRGQIFSALVSVTIPMGIVQGSSTQNDYTATFWLVCFLYWLLILKVKPGIWNSLALGASLGLALFTKGTAYLYALPFLIWLSVSMLKNWKPRNILLLSLAALTTLAINLGFYIRNYELFSSPLVDQDIQVGFYTVGDNNKLSNDIFSIPAMISNAIRNIAINLGTPFSSINTFFDKTIYLVHQVIGISPNDPRTTIIGEFHVPSISFTDNSTGNFLHVVLIMIAIFLILHQKKDMILYCTSLTFAFLAFSFYLKWQPWNSRLELPLFSLWSSIIGISLASVKKKWIGNAVMILVFLGVLPWVFLNPDRPLIGSQNIFNTSRVKQYFMPLPSSYLLSYKTADQLLVNLQCKQIGLYMNIDDLEYPFWVLLKRDIGKDVIIEDVNVENISAAKYGEFPEFTPCAVLVVNPLTLDNFQVNGVGYSIYQTTPNVTILVPNKLVQGISFLQH